MSAEHENDICIGDDQWIHYVDIVDKRDSAVDVDYLLLRVEELWRSLETLCVAQCCGIHAFDFYPDNIQNVGASLNIKHLGNKLKDIQKELENLASDVFVSSRLNQYFHQSVLLQLLKHISENLGQTKHE